MKKLILYLALLAQGFSEEISYNRHIRPILSDKYFSCHGQDNKKIKGHLQLHTYKHATKKKGKKY